MEKWLKLLVISKQNKTKQNKQTKIKSIDQKYKNQTNWRLHKKKKKEHHDNKIMSVQITWSLFEELSVWDWTQCIKIIKNNNNREQKTKKRKWKWCKMGKCNNNFTQNCRNQKLQKNKNCKIIFKKK